MDLIRHLIGPDEGYQTMAQLSARTVLVFVFGVLCVRIAGRRTFSKAAPLDIIVYLIVGSNLSAIITGRVHMFPSMAATLTLVVLRRLLAAATVRHNAVSDWLKSRPTVLVRDGRTDERAMARQGISEEDLLEALRMEQAERPADVRLATLERGGQISVIPLEREPS